MMRIELPLLDDLEDCILLTSYSGVIYFLNRAAQSLFSSLGLYPFRDGERNILILDPRLLGDPDRDGSWSFLYRGVEFTLHRFAVAGSEGWSGYLYLFADSYATSYRLTQLLRAVSDYVTILNLDGYVEKASTSVEAMAADDIEIEDSFGTNSIKEAKRPLEETVFHRILTSRAPVQDRIELENGQYITWTGVPLLDGRGEAAKVVFVGKDITRAIRSSQQLHKAERQKGAHKAKLQKVKDFLNNSGLVYNSDKMSEVIRTAIKAAPGDVPVMITGESGVGKDVIADVIYQNSLRNGKPYLPINCAAIPENLVESELFGYEAGAFTRTAEALCVAPSTLYRKISAGKLHIYEENRRFL